MVSLERENHHQSSEVSELQSKLEEAKIKITRKGEKKKSLKHENLYLKENIEELKLKNQKTLKKVEKKKEKISNLE